MIKFKHIIVPIFMIFIIHDTLLSQFNCDKIKTIRESINSINNDEYGKIKEIIDKMVRMVDEQQNINSTVAQIAVCQNAKSIWENSFNLNFDSEDGRHLQIQTIKNRLLFPLSDLTSVFCYEYDSKSNKMVWENLQTSINTSDANILTNKGLLEKLKSSVETKAGEIMKEIAKVCKGNAGVSPQAVDLEKLAANIQLILDEIKHTNDPRNLRILLEAMSKSIVKIDELLINMDGNLGSMKKSIENMDAAISIMKTSINNIEGQTTKISKWVDMNDVTTFLLGGSIMQNGGVGVHLSCLGSIVNNDINWLQVGLDAASLPTHNSKEPYYGAHIGFLIKDRVLTSFRGFVPRNGDKFGNMFTVSVSIKTGTNFFVGGQYSYLTGLGITILAGI